eukprot:755656-Hanusia_phi.AAC.3
MHIDYFRDLPMDATILLENVLDPTHLPFTHHRTISRRQRASPLTLTIAQGLSPSGFSASKTAGKVENASKLGGSVRFIAPNTVISVTNRENSFSDWNVVYAVPQAPGLSRIFVRIVFETAKMPLPLQLIFKFSFSLPSFLLHLNNHKILEDDNIFLHFQGRVLKHEARYRNGTLLSPDWRARYFLPTKSDALVSMKASSAKFSMISIRGAFRQWVEKYTGGEGAAWSPYATELNSDRISWTREELLEVKDFCFRACH